MDGYRVVVLGVHRAARVAAVACAARTPEVRREVCCVGLYAGPEP